MLRPQESRSIGRPKRIGIWFFALTALLFSSALKAAPAQAHYAALTERQPLSVGVTEDSYPYGFVTADGKWSGYSSDLMDAVARTMHLTIRRVAARSKDSHARFQNGEFDLLQAFSQTPDREQFADFSVPYLTLQGAIFVARRGSPIKTLKDFNARSFAIIGTSSVGERFLRDHDLHPSILRVSSSEEGLHAVESGAAAGIFMSQLTSASLIDQKHFRNIVMFGEPFHGYDIRHCFAVHKGDAELLARLNEGLAILNRTGEAQTIYDRWFGRILSPLFTREQVQSYVAAALALAFLATLWGLLRQRALGRRISRQAAELSAKEALLQALYDNIPMAIGVIEAAPEGHRMVAINRQAEPYFCVPPREVAGQMLDNLKLEPGWARELRNLLGRWPAEGTLLREERNVPERDRILMFTLVPLPHGPQGYRRVCVLVEDVSERRQLDEEIAQGRKLRAVGELVGGIAHEFNNLLTPVMLKVDDIEQSRSSDHALGDELNVIRLAARRAAELTRRLLTFGRKSGTEAENISLHAAVNSVFELLRQTVDRRIVLVNRVPADLPVLCLNATDLNQVLLNLLINARDTVVDKLERQPAGWEPCISVEGSSAAGSTVSRSPFKTFVRPIGWQRLTVRDNGMGIPPAIRDRIFEPFFTTKEVGKGTGLGLATVWHLVTGFGGTVEIDSAPDDGSAFHVLLPVHAGRPSGPMPVLARAVASTQATRVFLVEDDEQVSSVICALIRHAGHEVEHMADGLNAWRHLETERERYGLFLFDVNMPGITGIELARRIRDAGSATPVIVMSGRLTTVELDAITKARVDRVLSKPFAMDELLSTVRECLSPSSRKPRPAAF
ncbi:MAG: transporter substrate-binding domain-containing protein [Opitutus sp.]